MRRFLIALFVCCLALPARVSAQTAADYVERGIGCEWEYDYDKAITAYTQALAVANPKDPKDKEAIFNAYNFRGYALYDKREYDKAIADFNQALAIEPQNAYVYIYRGGAWDAKGENDKAIADYTKAIEIDPTNTIAYHNRGGTWCAKGEYGKAIADYTKAVAIDPKYYWGYNSLAWIYATCPDAKYRDGKKAVEIATEGSPLTGVYDWDHLDTLAAACAESGDFAKAREHQEQAAGLAPKESQLALRSRLELYKQGKPYHKQPVKK